jgi:hypothetical protein
MWSLTSPHEGRTGGPEKFRSAVKEDFFNTIGQKRKFRRACLAAALLEASDNMCVV